MDCAVRIRPPWRQPRGALFVLEQATLYQGFMPESPGSKVTTEIELGGAQRDP